MGDRLSQSFFKSKWPPRQLFHPHLMRANISDSEAFGSFCPFSAGIAYEMRGRKRYSLSGCGYAGSRSAFGSR
jgi:hypothetical protein